jgi:hypothetical protein
MSIIASGILVALFQISYHEIYIPVTFSHLQTTFDAIFVSSASVPLESFFPTGPIFKPRMPAKI